MALYANVDRYEEDDLVVLVFDDEQQLVLARRALPPAARPGTAVRVTLDTTPAHGILRGHDMPADAALDSGAPTGERAAIPVCVAAPAGSAAAARETVALLDDGQRLTIHDAQPPEPGAGPEQRAWLVLEVDADETARRRAHVRALVERLVDSGAVSDAAPD
jgi:hypothetical protein